MFHQSLLIAFICMELPTEIALIHYKKEKILLSGVNPPPLPNAVSHSPPAPHTSLQLEDYMDSKLCTISGVSLSNVIQTSK